MWRRQLLSVQGSWHLGQVQVGLSQARRLCRCSRLRVTLAEATHMQVPTLSPAQHHLAHYLLFVSSCHLLAPWAACQTSTGCDIVTSRTGSGTAISMVLVATQSLQHIGTRIVRPACLRGC